MNAAWQTRCLQRLARSFCVRCRNQSRHPMLCLVRPFSSSLFCREELNQDRIEAFSAAPEIDFSKLSPSTNSDNAHIVPASPSYFTGSPKYMDTLLALESLLRKYQSLPLANPADMPRTAWIKPAQMQLLIGEEMKLARYKNIMKIVQRLNSIHPDLMPKEVEEQLKPFRRRGDPYKKIEHVRYIDQYGRALGVGRRKSSTARAWVVEGDGQILVNGKNLTEVFSRFHDRESVTWPLTTTERADKYNVWVLVNGGGTTGQAEAITLAIAKALLIHEPDLKPALRKAGCITRDMRRVERKKPGHLKARKMPGWVKR